MSKLVDLMAKKYWSDKRGSGDTVDTFDELGRWLDDNKIKMTMTVKAGRWEVRFSKRGHSETFVASDLRGAINQAMDRFLSRFSG